MDDWKKEVDGMKTEIGGLVDDFGPGMDLSNEQRERMNEIKNIESA